MDSGDPGEVRVLSAEELLIVASPTRERGEELLIVAGPKGGDGKELLIVASPGRQRSPGPARGDRDAILRRFEAWLDEVLRPEEPPQGIAAELLAALDSDEPVHNPESDLYSMQAAVTALTQEVKLQSRSYKQLNDTLAPVAELHPRIDEVLAQYSDVVAELRHDAETHARAEILDALLDMRDRLARGLESSRVWVDEAAAVSGAERRSWYARMFGRIFARFMDRGAQSGEAARLAALEKGYQLSLDRLDEILSRFGVSEISSLDQEFDPESMSAVDTEETGRVPEGTVLDVYRAGYEWNGKVYRTAQVKVARAPKLNGGINE